MFCWTNRQKMCVTQQSGSSSLSHSLLCTPVEIKFIFWINYSTLRTWPCRPFFIRRHYMIKCTIYALLPLRQHVLIFTLCEHVPYLLSSMIGEWIDLMTTDGQLQAAGFSFGYGGEEWRGEERCGKREREERREKRGEERKGEER